MTISPALMASPAYQAFMRVLGVEEVEDAATTQDEVDERQEALERQLPRVLQRGEYEREDISGSFEDRGLFRSGAHEVSLARQRSAEGERVGDLITDTELGVADLERAAARRRMARSRRAAEAGIEAASEVY